MAPEAAAAWRALEPVAQGATSTVWLGQPRAGGRTVALKIAREGDASSQALRREASLLARVQRRWGPALLDVHPGVLVTEWVQGSPPSLSLSPSPGAEADRERSAAVVAHAVARALEELHAAGVRHGDVKPANVLVAGAGHVPSRDAAEDRGATLIDLGLATDFDADALGATPRYAAPELRGGDDAGPAADLWALGILLAELLDPAVARAGDPRGAIAAWRDAPGEPARWVQALVAPAPGGRPGASWIAERAARWLGLASDPAEGERSRVERVRRSYLAERRREIVAGATVSGEVGEPATSWLRQAIGWAEKIAPDAASPGARLEALGPLRRARWLVNLIGPSAAAWPLGASEAGQERETVAAAVALARVQEPSSWTLDDFRSREPAKQAVRGNSEAGIDATVRIVRELARPAPDAEALALAEDELARAGSAALAVHLASALARRGEIGRAWAALAGIQGAEADALRAEVARRRGDLDAACAAAERALTAAPDGPVRWSAQATLARLAWDAGDPASVDARLEGARGPAAAEVRALAAWRKGTYEAGMQEIEAALAGPVDGEALARLEGARGLLEHGRGSSAPALVAFGRAVEMAARSGAVIEEATYLTSEAAAAADAGDVGRALASATRAALLWERLGRPERAARAWLARASALATVGAAHATDEAATEAITRARQSRDALAAAYARLAQIEVRPPGDERARAWAVATFEQLRGSSADDRVRAAARVLVWAPDAIDAGEIAACDEGARGASSPARWEWWGARAHALAEARSRGAARDGAAAPAAADKAVLAALLALLDAPAPLGSRGPALDAGVRLAAELGDGEASRRLEAARAAAARTLREGAPPALRSGIASVPWARAPAVDGEGPAFAPEQVAQLEAIVRSLSGRERLGPLLAQVLDTMVLWTGVERGLLLLRAPDGRLVPRAARNLARRDLAGEQLALSQTIARRAIEEGDAVVATDAFASLGDLHASVHALRLRSVLAVPLLARGEALGVVYLDDRVRKGAFGRRELAWVRVVATQAAMAIADARDAVLLRRAVRRAERARASAERLLREREVELDATRTQLDLVRDGRETRYRYDEIAGRSEAMRELLALVDRVTASDVPVLVIGESGTGKELIARAMHGNGPRARRPFVSENCASVPETLLESTLFGHVRGAFTGAATTRAGLFDVADGGTLFLDEIGEMSLGMQGKLLRVLENGEVRPVGGERSRRVDVRIIGATHRDLEAMVAAGKFREDLFYRLNVVTLRVPPLRERSEDIPVLVEHLVAKHAGGRPVKVTRGAMAKLMAFPWPGNVRQLENEVRRALVLGEGGIDVADLSADVVRGGPSAARGAGMDLRARVDALEAELVTEALLKTRGNQTRAAQALGLSRFGLQKMIKRLGLQVP